MKFLHNIIANLATGLSQALLQVLAVGIIGRTLGQDEVSVWALGTSLALIPSLVSCNLSTIVTRLALDRSDQLSEVRLFAERKEAQLLIASGLIGAILMAITFWRFSGKFAIANWFGVIVALYLGGMGVIASQVAWGELVSRLQNWKIASAVMWGRIAALAGLTAAIFLTRNLIVGAVVFATALWLTVPLLKHKIRWNGGAASVRDREARDSAINNEIQRLLVSFALWNIASALIQQLTLPVIGFFDPAAISAALIATTAIAVFMGVLSAISGAALPFVKAKIADKTDSKLRGFAISSIMCAGGAACLFILVFLMLDPIASVWLKRGPLQPQERWVCGALFLQVTIRCLAIPASVVLTAVGTARSISLSPVLESITVVGLGLLLGFAWGLHGYLVALVFAAIFAAAVALTCAVNALRTAQRT